MELELKLLKLSVIYAEFMLNLLFVCLLRVYVCCFLLAADCQLEAQCVNCESNSFELKNELGTCKFIAFALVF